MSTSINITDGVGTLATEFQLDAAGFAALLERLGSHPGVTIAKVSYDDFFGTGEFELQLSGVDNPVEVLRLFEPR